MESCILSQETLEDILHNDSTNPQLANQTIVLATPATQPCRTRYSEVEDPEQETATLLKKSAKTWRLQPPDLPAEEEKLKTLMIARQSSSRRCSPDRTVVKPGNTVTIQRRFKEGKTFMLAAQRGLAPRMLRWTVYCWSIYH